VSDVSIKHGCPLDSVTVIVAAPIACYTDAIPMRFEVPAMDENLASEPQW